MHAYTHARMHARTHKRMHDRMPERMHECMHKHMHIQTLKLVFCGCSASTANNILRYCSVPLHSQDVATVAGRTAGTVSATSQRRCTTKPDPHHITAPVGTTIHPDQLFGTVVSL